MSNDLHRNTFHLQGGNLQPPWETLSKFEEKYLNTSKVFDKYVVTIEEAKLKTSMINMEEYEEKVNKIKKQFKRSENKLKTVQNDEKTISDSLDDLLEDIYDSDTKLVRLISRLNNFLKTNITTTDALKEATKLLKEIKLSSNIDVDKVNRTLKSCEKTNELVNKIYNHTFLNTQRAKDKLRDINLKLNELESISQKIKSNVTLTNSRSKINNDLIQMLKWKIEKIKEKNENVTKELKEISNTIDGNIKFLDDIEKLQHQYKNLEFKKILADMKNKQNKIDDNWKSLEETVKKASDYSMQLQKTAEEYKQ